MTDNIETYLTIQDFECIPGIPGAFSLKTMQPYWLLFRRTWLDNILPPTNAFWAIEPPNDTESSAKIRAAFKSFAVVALWASYVNMGDLSQTGSGLHTKTNTSSEALDEKRRAELYRTFTDMAVGEARKLVDLLNVPDQCAPVTRAVGGVRVSSVMPRNTSPFQ